MDEGLNTDKDYWRRELKKRRKAIGDEKRKLAADSAARRLAGSALWAQSEVVAVYSPLPGEFDPTPITVRAWNDNKTVCLPKVDRGDMRFFLWEQGAGLEAGSFGISEPTSDQEITNIDLLVMPLVGWTQNGTRLGMGAGYYDRFLDRSGNQVVHYLGLAFDCQQEPALDKLAEAHDVRIPTILSETTLLSLNS
ncbi:MAG: 5-formyltetrahydrofolate cyclo-ligase [Pseudomonadota bacterium]